MDTIIWLDGHTSKISSKEANSKSYNIITRGRCEFRLILQNSEFAWRCKMQITKFNIYGRIHSLYSRAYKRQETTSL